MSDPAFSSLPPLIAEALTARGFTALTPVQEAVLDPDLAGKDLRISSQTGSGKTIAVGLVLAEGVAAAAANPPSPLEDKPRAARPYALIIAPTRELAAQISRELSWLYAPLGVKVAAVTGGTAYSGELRALRTHPLVIAATPGRLLDHLDRRSIDPSALGAVILDEADQMLDLGFRDELEAILAKLPEARRTHLMSATFSREVLSLANRYQPNAEPIAGTPIGDAHEDITHVVHLIRPDERLAVLRNLLLMAPSERTLVFVRTRADTADIADRLEEMGFSARALSGELEQWERTKTLDAFRSGVVTTLVATDVAARGIDVPEVGRVIHFDAPGDSDAYTHRSGRTGRAGRKGTSIILAAVAGRDHVARILRRARVEAVTRTAPTPADVLKAADDRFRAELAAEAATETKPDERLRSLATELLASMDPVALVTTLLARVRHSGPCEPVPVTNFEPPAARTARTMPPPPRGDGRDQRDSRGGPPARGSVRFVPFRVTWGGRHGADPRRLLALVCRRGEIHGDEVGAIRIGETSSTFEVSAVVAERFALAAGRPDERDPRVKIMPFVEEERRPREAPARPMRPAPAAPKPPRKDGYAPPQRKPKPVKG